MAKVVSCRDLGVDCDFVGRAETEKELLEKCAAHARTAHNMQEIPPELVAKVRASIRTE
jgi:predicted small metal-binding protein